MSVIILATYGAGVATLQQSPAMLPVGAAFLPSETLVTAAGTQSVHIPDAVKCILKKPS